MKIPKKDREFLIERLESIIMMCGEECENCKYDRRLIKKLEENSEFSKDEVLSLATRRSYTHKFEEIKKIIKRWKEGKEAYDEGEIEAICAINGIKAVFYLKEILKSLDKLMKIENEQKRV